MPFFQRTFEYLSTSTEHSSNNWKIVATRERSQSLLPIPPSWAILQIFGCASSAINSLWEQHQKMQFFTIWRRSALRINFAILLALALFFGIWGFWNKQVELLPLQREQCFPKSNYVSCWIQQTVETLVLNFELIFSTICFQSIILSCFDFSFLSFSFSRSAGEDFPGPATRHDLLWQWVFGLVDICRKD